MKKQSAKIRKQFEVHFDDTTFFIANHRICAVHETPDHYTPDTELDFYVDNNAFIFLLRLQNSKNNAIHFYPATRLSLIPDIVLQKELTEDIHTELAAILPRIADIDMTIKQKQIYPFK